MKHQGTVMLETERLMLRRFAVEDGQAMYDNWASDDEVTRFLTWPTHSSVDVTNAILKEWTESYVNPDFYQWAITVKAEGDQPVGSISVVSLKEKIGRAEIGYCIGRRWWHRGITSEALKAVIAFLFDRVGANCVAARHDLKNPHSGAVMRKAGMAYEGTLRQAARSNQGICDVSCYSILAEERGKSMTRHEIPVLEHDNDPGAVISPDHEGLDARLPRKAVFAFLGERIQRYAELVGGRQVVCFMSNTKPFPVYVITYKGEEICLCQAPVGAAPAAQLLDWLIGYGVREIVSAGACGGLVELPEGAFLVPCKALRDEGASYHYAPPARYIEVDAAARNAIEKALAERGLKYVECVTWSTDGFFRETKEKVESRRQEGCAVVEMECAALAACARLRGATWGEILYTADSLADVDRYDQRDWGGDAGDLALRLCLDAVLHMNG